MRLTRWRVAGMAAAVLFTGCGEGESAAPATTVAPATTTTLSQVDLDRQKAQRIVLTAADVPGFTADPPDPVDGSDTLEEQAAPCFNNNRLLVRVGQPSDSRGAASPDFSKGRDIGVGSGVTFAATEDEARSALADIGAASFPACFSKVLSDDLQGAPGVTNVSATTTRLPALAVGDQSVGYRSVLKARSSGTSVTLNFDFTFIRSGRAVAILDAFSTGAPFPTAERSRLATLLAGRMAAP
jgi:hypothetical protein